MTETDTTADRPIDPQKLLRIASLVREVLEEARKMGPDSSTAPGLASLYGRVQGQLAEALPKELFDELEAIDLDMTFGEKATGEDVRVAYSGLIGWLGGLFQGLQASVQMQTLLQLEKGAEAQEEDIARLQKKEGYL